MHTLLLAGCCLMRQVCYCYPLGERVSDIAYWKSELNIEIGAMENEINDLKVLLTSLLLTASSPLPHPGAGAFISVLLL
jgi:hypothetical protein